MKNREILPRGILMQTLLLRRRGSKFCALSFAVRSRLEFFYLTKSVKISREVFSFATAWNSAQIENLPLSLTRARAIKFSLVTSRRLIDRSL
ncbi:hypothetical protein CAMGR0001_2438 [Campylobacter gracilis RM3268]|uniref:Uncharacterized protein n=1 Tax=Campylobacter gracilis RM3268 TaxID=553220 RepID=C8PE87_9BACT|nr:hypothetical protein CAMGR0001_2438 [Campylobacter gracilis RM3268]